MSRQGKGRRGRPSSVNGQAPHVSIRRPSSVKERAPQVSIGPPLKCQYRGRVPNRLIHNFGG
ncbi:hypothetical protein IPC1103_29020 [Pseudomonas aeruginosa]|nr:hypothetical protein IPC1103_29020 [Pseudomonas aeruginosa]